MPNIVRTLAKCTIINQYLDFCKEENFSPMSRATLWGILEVQEASQRKSPKGLDNTVADGVDGFEALHKILDQLEEVGANKEWCAQTCTRLKEAKLYLKRTHRDNCKAGDQCPDHCTGFTLSDPADADYCTDCSHDHNISCNDCEALKEAIQRIHSVIVKYSSKINNKEREDDLRHDELVAEEKVKEWKAHIMSAHDQENARKAFCFLFGRTKFLYYLTGQ